MGRTGFWSVAKYATPICIFVSVSCFETSSWELPPDTRTRAVPSPSDPALEAALLHESDLGKGWNRSAASQIRITVPDHIYCGRKMDSLPHTAHAVYHGIKDDAFQVDEVLSPRPDAEAAHDSMRQLADAVEGCGSLTAMDGTAESMYNIEQIEFPTIGDESVALRVTGRIEVPEDRSPIPIPGLPDSLEIYFVQARFDSLIMQLGVEYLGTGDPERAKEIALAASERYEAEQTP